MKYKIDITGEPKGQPRPRAFARKMGNKYVARMYHPDTADDWRKAVMMACRDALQHDWSGPSRAPFAVRMQFFFTRPKSHFTSKGALNPRAPASHTKRPDIDNLVKAVMDAVTDTELFWFDDSQVVELLVSKSWSMESRCLLELQTI